MRKLLIVLLGTLLASGFIYLAVKEAVNVKKTQKIDSIKIESKQLEVNKLELDLKQLNLDLKEQLQKDTLDQKQIDKLQKEIKDSQEREKALERDLISKRAKQQADKERASKVAQRALNTITNTKTAYASTGNRGALMTQAGIPSSEQSSAEQLVHRESSWNANAYNSIGACSLVQALPCSKISGNWRDPVTALSWGNGYVKARYGTWHNALNHSLQNNWY